MRLSILPLFVLLVAATAAQDKAIDSSGDYYMDLGQIYGAIRMSKELGDTCTRAFPHQADANAIAYAQWRKEYLPFLEEMEGHYSAMTWRMSEDDPEKHSAMLSESERAFDGHRDRLTTQLRSEGNEVFEKHCSLYPTYLASPRMNLEDHYAAHVAVVRSGPAE